MTAGDKVAVFIDPTNKTGYEGEAELVRMVASFKANGRSYEEWEVIFNGDDYLSRRFIRTN